MLSKLFISIILFTFTLLWMKPWRKSLELSNIIYLLMIDAFSFSIGFNLNYYKIFSLIRIKYLRSLNMQVLIGGVLLLFTFISGLIFICVHPELKDPLSSSFINLPIIRILRNQFTLITSFIFGYFLFKELKFKKSFVDLLKPFEIVGIVISLGILFEVIFKIDLYSVATGATSITYGIDYFRAKGISYEPRGAAQALSGCVLAILFYSSPRKFIFLAILFYVSLFFTLSLSGIVMTTLLLGFVFLRAIFMKDKTLIQRCLISIIVLATVSSVYWKLNLLQSNIEQRAYVYGGNASADTNEIEKENHSIGYKLVNKFEVFDAAYLNFLKNEPMFILWGTGSGMAGFASQKYILPKDKRLYPLGVTSAPLMGVVYLLSQFGIFVSFLIVLLAVKGLVFSKENEKFFLFLLVCLFLLQYYYYLVFFIAILFFQLDQSKKIRQWLARKRIHKVSQVDV